MPEPSRAEVVALKALQELYRERVGALLIGGYAVSSYSFARTSVDLDLVIDSRRAARARERLRSLEFAVSKSRRLRGGRYDEGYELWEHDSGARVDLLVGGVQDRGVAFWMEHGYLARHSEEREIRATFGAAPLRGLVATRELLIALKLQPFRLVDRRDIFALCFEPRDSTRMKGHLDYVQAPLLAKRFRQMPAIVRERAFEDSFKGLYRIASPRWIGRLTRNLDALVRDAASDD